MVVEATAEALEAAEAAEEAAAAVATVEAAASSASVAASSAREKVESLIASGARKVLIDAAAARPENGKQRRLACIDILAPSGQADNCPA